MNEKDKIEHELSQEIQKILSLKARIQQDDGVPNLLDAFKNNPSGLSTNSDLVSQEDDTDIIDDDHNSFDLTLPIQFDKNLQKLEDNIGTRTVKAIKIAHQLNIKKIDYQGRALEILGNKCVNCGITDRDILNIDHVKNDGKEDPDRTNLARNVIKEYENGMDIFENYQCLCTGCNMKKHRVNQRRLKAGLMPFEKIKEGFFDLRKDSSRKS